MPIHELYSKEQKRLRGDVRDTFTYDNIPQPLRVQIVRILHATLRYTDFNYRTFVEILRDEFGEFRLAEPIHLLLPPFDDYNFVRDDYCKEFFHVLLHEPNIDRMIDTIQLSFGEIENGGYGRAGKSAISELNCRFSEHGVGYRFESGKIVRVDSEFVHQEIVKPALRIVSGKIYEGAQEEFLKAHEHLRKGNTKGALNEASKAFESTLKAICSKHGWPSPEGAAKLVKLCFEKELIDKYWQDHFTHLEGLLKSTSTARNKRGAHGQGEKPVEVPAHVAAYALNMTASAVVFLASCENETKLK